MTMSLLFLELVLSGVEDVLTSTAGLEDVDCEEAGDPFADCPPLGTGSVVGE